MSGGNRKHRLRHKDEERMRERESGRGGKSVRETDRLKETETRLKREQRQGPGAPPSLRLLLCLALPLRHCTGQKTLAWRAELLS